MSIPYYERQIEYLGDDNVPDTGDLISFRELEYRLECSSLSVGSRALVRGLCRLGHPAMFRGGGIGIEYAGLLKNAANPHYLRSHIQEVAHHLHAQGVHMLIAPGISGYPIGSMYAAVADLPIILLRKTRIDRNQDACHPTGSFVISSYTSDGNFLMSADLAAVQDMVDQILTSQIADQSGSDGLKLSLRMAGADDMIDKATMSQAVSESALVIGRSAAESFVSRYQERTGGARSIDIHVAVVAWATPLIKDYNRPRELLQRLFGIDPFAGISVTSVQLDPPAIGVAGLGTIEFPRRECLS